MRAPEGLLRRCLLCCEFLFVVVSCMDCSFRRRSSTLMDDPLLDDRRGLGVTDATDQLSHTCCGHVPLMENRRIIMIHYLMYIKMDASTHVQKIKLTTPKPASSDT